jgi:short-subunit dehydrogenase
MELLAIGQRRMRNLVMKSQGEWSDRVIVITGASSGIGRATALACAHNRAKLVLCARDANSLEEAANECRSQGSEVQAQPLDVADLPALEKVREDAIGVYGRIDVWINNASVLAFGRFEDVTPDVFRRVIETNFLGCVNGSRIALTQFGVQGDTGTLINIGSLLGVVSEPYASAYVATKFAIRGFTASLRQEARDRPNLHICAVLPPAIDTPIYQKAANAFGRKARSIFPVDASDRVARIIVRLIDHPRAEVTVGVVGNTIKIAARISPMLLERIAGRFAPTMQFQTLAASPTKGNLFETSEPQAIDGGWKQYWSSQLRNWFP